MKINSAFYVSLFVTLASILVVRQAHAESFNYHGIEAIKCNNLIRTGKSNLSEPQQGRIQFSGTGIAPYFGVRLDSVFAIEGGYLYSAEKQKSSIGNSLKPFGIESAAGNARPSYKLQGPHVNLVINLPPFPKSNLNVFFSVGIFPSTIKFNFSPTATFWKLPEGGSFQEFSPLKIRKVFAKFRVGVSHSFNESLSFRIALLLLQPDFINFSEKEHPFIREFRNHTHVSAGLQWSWK